MIGCEPTSSPTSSNETKLCWVFTTPRDFGVYSWEDVHVYTQACDEQHKAAGLKDVLHTKSVKTLINDNIWYLFLQLYQIMAAFVVSISSKKIDFWILLC